MPTIYTPTFCRNCVASCGMEIGVANGRVVDIRPDKANAATQGYMCIKGYMSGDLHGGAEGRITGMRRRGAGGLFEEVDSDVGFEEMGERLARIVKRHGPRAVALFAGTGSYIDALGQPIAKSFMAELGSPNIFTTMTIDQSAKWVTYARMGVYLPGKRMLEDTDVALIVGSNPLVSHLGYPWSPIPSTNPGAHLRAFKKRGGKLIVIDPRRTETARLADVFIQPFPGEDAAIMASLIRIILANQWENRAFTDRFASNVEKLKQEVADFSVERVAARAGIDPQQLLAAAEMFGTAKSPCAGSGTGPDMANSSNLAEHLIEALNAICAGYVLPGEIIRHPGFFLPKSRVASVAPPDRSWEHEPKCHSANFGQVMGEFPSSLLPDEILTPGAEKIRALIVYGGNPVKAIGEPDKVVAALEDLELLIVIDPRPTETAALAHYVVPPTLPLEKEDVSGATDFAFWRPFAIYAPAILPAPAGVVNEIEIFWRLARHLGLTLQLKRVPIGGRYQDAPDGFVLDMSHPPRREAMLEWLCSATTDITLDQLKAHPHGFAPDLPALRLETAPDDDGARLDLCPLDVADEIRALAQIPLPDETAFRLTPRRLLETLNGMFRHSPRTARRMKRNSLFMNPADLEARGFDEDKPVCVKSRAGEIIAYVKADASMRRGVVSMNHCWGNPDKALDPLGLEGAHSSRLVSIDADLETINRMPLQSNIIVTIERCSGAPA